jgi:peptidoglycan/LPS O-acetylase OafA/YrhL
MVGASPVISEGVTGAAPRIRLEFLDGIRGLAALWVAITHTYFRFCLQFPLPERAAKVLHFLYLGRAGVDIFIVLSGYCLMLPVVRSGDRLLPGGLRSFFARRARRILPTYYAALAACCLLIGICPWLHDRSNPAWSGIFPVYRWDVLLSHVLLIHNLDPFWSHRIDYPMWSIATEWQIYFLFALILLPIWRRFGTFAVGCAAFAIGFALLRIFPHALSEASPHFLGLFALGMIAAEINFSRAEKMAALNRRLPWGWLGALSFAAIGAASTRTIHASVMAKDVLMGFGTAFLIMHCARALSSGLPAQRSPLLRILESRPAVGLGAFSYSLYLVHAPVIASVQPLVRALHLPPMPSLAAMFFLTIPAIVGVTYIFYLLFERPFMADASRAGFVWRKALVNRSR